MADLVLGGLTKRFGTVAAVDGIDLKVEHGLLCCLLGPSGCGKTTTLRLVAGFIEPDGGTIAVGGKLLSDARASLPPERRAMSMIFQSYALWPHMTLFDNVAYGLVLRGLGREAIRAKVEEFLKAIRMEALAERYPGELSGGQQQRVALARALIVEPEILLLDEPLSNLDANLREEMRFELRRLHDRYRYTTLYVTHDQAEAMSTADLIVVMNHGRIEQAGPPETIYNRPASAFVARFIGGTNILKARRLDAQHVAVGDLALRCASVPATGDLVVSIRMHQIALAANRAEGTANTAAVTIRRRVFLGASNDYLVELADGSQLRVTTTPETDLAVGARAWVGLPERHCLALAE
ncbi:MAG: ABC transporter ATP-binding protein [Alphaproteobacteria bacterium]|nr:ABC transporter ATP-binding protein [Alphaproteobacteria bacterium]